MQETLKEPSKEMVKALKRTLKGSDERSEFRKGC